MGIDVKDDNFGAVLNCAVRYCLGRQTYDEHKKAMQVDVFDGYAVISINKEKEPEPAPEKLETRIPTGTTESNAMMSMKLEVENDAGMSSNYFY